MSSKGAERVTPAQSRAALNLAIRKFEKEEDVRRRETEATMAGGVKRVTKKPAAKKTAAKKKTTTKKKTTAKKSTRK